MSESDDINTQNPINYLDRLCQQLPKNETDEADCPKQLLSELTNDAFILLGEPGMGKTQSLRALAAHRQGVFITVADFLIETADTLDTNTFYCIDALDEARLDKSNGSLQSLRKLIKQARLTKFCISCRSADWHSTDTQSVQQIASNIMAFELLPLNASQVTQLLMSQSIVNTSEFLEQAETLGFVDMLGNPQSLMLLTQAYNNNQQLPNNRRDAYELACKAQLTEHNVNHIHNQNTSAILNDEQLFNAAGWLCALLLLSNISEIHTPTERYESTTIALKKVLNLNDVLNQIPSIGGQPAFTSIEVTHVLQTRLFSKPQANSYTPIHRTIAEYLAARYLDKQMQAGLLQTRLSALMLTSFEDKAYLISNLRGLAGWLASLNERMRDEILAADPEAILDYGDLYLLNNPAKEKLIAELSQRPDFYFKSAHWQRLSSLAPLVDAGMSEFIRQWLLGLSTLGIISRSAETVADLLLGAISKIDYSPSWGASLVDLVRNPQLPDHIRRIALDGVAQHCPVQIQLKILDDIQKNVLADNELSLMGDILSRLYPQHLSPEQVLACINLLKDRLNINSYHMFWKHELLKKTTSAQLLAWTDAIEQAIAQGGFRLNEHENYDSANPELGVLALNAILNHGATQPIEKLALWLSWCHDFQSPFELEKVGDRKALVNWQIANPVLMEAVIAHRLYTKDDFWFADHILMGNEAYPADMGRFWLGQVDNLLQKTNIPQYIERAQRCLSNAYFWLEKMQHEAGIDFDDIERVVLHHEGLHQVWASLMVEPLDDNWKRKHWQREQKNELHKQAEQTLQQENLDYLLAHLSDIASGKLNQYLSAAAWAEMPSSYINNQEHNWIVEQLSQYPALKVATHQGYVDTLKNLTAASDKQALAARKNNQSLYVELPALLGARFLFEQNTSEFLSLSSEKIKTLLRFVFLQGMNGELPDWFFALIERHPDIVQTIWLDAAQIKMQKMAKPAPSNSSGSVPFLYSLIHEPRLRLMAQVLLPQFLTSLPIRLTKEHARTFADILFGLIRLVPHELHELIQERLQKKSLDNWQKAYLTMAGLWILPAQYVSQLKSLSTQPNRTREPYLEFVSYNSRYGRRDVECLPHAPWSMDIMVLIFRLFAPLCPATHPAGVYSPTSADDGRDFLYGVSAQFLDDVSEVGLSGLQGLCDDLIQSDWHTHLQAQMCKYAQALSERAYAIPKPAQIARTLNNKTPANHTDLMALAIDALAELQKTIVNNDTNLINRFWSVDSNGKHPITPHRPESECRNVIADWLRNHLRQYDISVVVENQHGAQNQSDIALQVIVAGHTELRLPIEVKGDWNRDLWAAPQKQLASKYGSDVVSKNTGVYLVLWAAEHRLKKPNGEMILSREVLKNELQKIVDEIDGVSIRVCVLNLAIGCISADTV